MAYYERFAGKERQWHGATSFHKKLSLHDYALMLMTFNLKLFNGFVMHELAGNKKARLYDGSMHHGQQQVIMLLL